MEITLAAAQIELKPFDLQANYQKIADICRQAAAQKCQMLCLPEECWAGPSYEESRPNEATDFMQEHASKLAKQYGLYLIAGTVIEQHEDKPQHTHNFCYVFSPSGEQIGRYAKRHLVPATEQELDPGSMHRVFDTEYGKIGVQICRDILYPEVTKVTADLGARIIFSPAFWSKFSSQTMSSVREFGANDELQTVKYMVPSRALENEVIFVFANAAGKYQTPKRREVLLGYSQICQPFSGPLVVLRHNKEQLIVRTVDTEVVDIARRGWRIRGH